MIAPKKIEMKGDGAEQAKQAVMALI